MARHYGKEASDAERWTFADKANRDALARTLTQAGWKVKRYSSRNQLLHPMYVDDRKQDVPEDQKGFGNTLYKTPFAALYMVKIIERKLDGMKRRRDQLEKEVAEATRPAYSVGVACDGFTVAQEDYKGHPVLAIYNGSPLPVVRFGVRKAIAIHAAKDEIQKFVEEHGE